MSNRNNLLNRIADYFKNWNGNDSSAPTMKLTIKDLREIAALNVEKCKLSQQVAKYNTRYNIGFQVNRTGTDDCNNILCPVCGYEVAKNKDCDEVRPKHCFDCGTKLLY